MTEIIVALDVDTLGQAEELLHRLHGTISFYKVGMRLFTAHGKRAVDLVRRFDGKVFLDLKLFDIPQTVSDAVRQAQHLGVQSVSLHLWGGGEMLKAATSVRPRPKLWGVTVLTSLSPDDLRFLHPGLELENLASRLARLGKTHRMDGIICSPHEVQSLSQALGGDTCFITPGIRPAQTIPDDQRRVMTPQQAARLGIRYLVIGRPITKAPDPLREAQDILADIKQAAPKSLEAP
ncbi:MAG: orotidine-5'-phosphate decarboxylase [Elusimicrobia bacterium]|nr:orotidine-5'-phosphate decarboxylase [Elusimicrobiota bacterium]